MDVHLLRFYLDLGKYCFSKVFYFSLRRLLSLRSRVVSFANGYPAGLSLEQRMRIGKLFLLSNAYLQGCGRTSSLAWRVYTRDIRATTT